MRKISRRENEGLFWKTDERGWAVIVRIANSSPDEAADEVDEWLRQIGVANFYFATMRMWGLHCGTWFDVHLPWETDYEKARAAVELTPWPDPFNRRGGAIPHDYRHNPTALA